MKITEINYKTMKITVERDDEKYTFEINGDKDIYDLSYELKKICYCLGYASESIESIFVSE